MAITYYDGNSYVQHTEADSLKGFLLGSAVSAAIMSPYPYFVRPFEKQLLKEHSQNHLYKDLFIKAYELSGLKEKGTSIVEAQNAAGLPLEYVLGRQAAYVPTSNQVWVNTDKISVTGFHELGHAMNSLMSKSGKLLQKMRKPGYFIAFLMEYYAIFSRTKPKGAPRNFQDYIEDNCGKITFLALSPILIEEAMASYKGVKLAKKVNMDKALVSNMKKLLSKAWFTYGSRVALASLAVGATRMVMDYYTRPKRVEH